MNLAKEISFLLYKHNCVILPGFGAFLVNEKAAELSEIARYALPRQKVITFRSEEHTSELQSRSDLVCRLLLEKKK